MCTNMHAKPELYVIRINKPQKVPTISGLYIGFKIRDFEKIKRNSQQIYAKNAQRFHGDARTA